MLKISKFNGIQNKACPNRLRKRDSVENFLYYCSFCA